MTLSDQWMIKGRVCGSCWYCIAKVVNPLTHVCSNPESHHYNNVIKPISDDCEHYSDLRKGPPDENE